MHNKVREPLFHIVKRDTLPWYQAWGIRAVAIVLALLLCALITTLCTHLNPIKVFGTMFGGAFGSHPDDVNAYAASTFYAVDRYAAYKQDWGGYYEAGGLLIADRYTTSNAVHQASKLPDGEREKFLDWLFGFEYGLLGLPEPSLVFYLDVPTEVTERLMRERERATHTAADIHEADDAYLRECRENARGVAARCGWQRVDCTRDGRMRGIEDIHEEVYARVKALLG